MKQIKKVSWRLALTIMMVASMLSFSGCGPSAQDEQWTQLSRQARRVQPFTTLDEALEIMTIAPDSRDDRNMLGVSRDTITILTWDRGYGKRVYMKFYNELAADLKSGIPWSL
jgi:hypothetical protein